MSRLSAQYPNLTPRLPRSRLPRSRFGVVQTMGAMQEEIDSLREQVAFLRQELVGRQNTVASSSPANTPSLPARTVANDSVTIDFAIFCRYFQRVVMDHVLAPGLALCAEKPITFVELEELPQHNNLAHLPKSHEPAKERGHAVVMAFLAQRSLDSIEKRYEKMMALHPELPEVIAYFEKARKTIGVRFPLITRALDEEALSTMFKQRDLFVDLSKEQQECLLWMLQVMYAHKIGGSITEDVLGTDA